MANTTNHPDDVKQPQWEIAGTKIDFMAPEIYKYLDFDKRDEYVALAQRGAGDCGQADRVRIRLDRR